MPFIDSGKEGGFPLLEPELPGTLDNCWFLMPEDSLSIYVNKCQLQHGVTYPSTLK
jgi:hypothetical protein